MHGRQGNSRTPQFAGAFCILQGARQGAYGPGTIFFCFALKRLNSGAISGL